MTGSRAFHVISMTVRAFGKAVSTRLGVRAAHPIVKRPEAQDPTAQPAVLQAAVDCIRSMDKSHLTAENFLRSSPVGLRAFQVHLHDRVGTALESLGDAIVAAAKGPRAKPYTAIAQALNGFQVHRLDKEAIRMVIVLADAVANASDVSKPAERVVLDRIVFRILLPAVTRGGVSGLPHATKYAFTGEASDTGTGPASRPAGEVLPEARDALAAGHNFIARVLAYGRG